MTAPAVSPTADTQTLLQQAMQEHTSGHFDEAQGLYAHVLEHQPEHADALHLLGVLQAQRGRHADAAELIGRAIQAQPGEAMFHNNLGNVFVEVERFQDAEREYAIAITLDPERVDALNNLGVLFSRTQRGDDAERALLQAVKLSPEFGDARQNLANHYLRAGRIADAVQQCFDGLIVAPRSNVLRRVLGLAYSLIDKNEQAIEVYRNWLRDEPDNEIARFHLAACTGQGVPERAPDEYVAGVFDSFAGSFDAKLAALDYRAPELVAQVVARRMAPAPATLRTLDAGCGTGLCGPLLAPWCKELVGVDLSVGMLRLAAQRRLYHGLFKADLVAFLQAHPAAYELVVSADTLCYFGALEAFAAAAAASLVGGGVLAFTVEAHEDSDAQPGSRLQPNGRYSHRRQYVHKALAEAGFGALEFEAVVLRMEAHEGVNGWLVSAVKPQ